MRHLRVSAPHPRLAAVSPSKNQSVAPVSSQSATGTTDTAERPRLLLIDGHSMAYRAFFAVPADRFRAPNARVPHAVFGFTSLRINLLRDEAPAHLAVAFDLSRKTFRSEPFAGYKATRSATP